MLYVAGILALLLCALAALYLATIAQLTRIVTSADEETPCPLFSGAFRWIPLIGAKTGELERLVADLRQSDTDHRTRYKILTENVAAAVMLHFPNGERSRGSDAP